MSERVTVADLLRTLGVERVEDLDDAVRWMLIELVLRREHEMTRRANEMIEAWMRGEQ